jgi:tRNA(fMet)-specific endonuclease VapC
MGLILDTNVFIKAEREGENIDFTKWQKYGDILISTITISELLVGVHLAKTQTIRLKRSAFVETIIANITSLPFDHEIARIHAEISSTLLKKGKKIGAHDLIIGATAIYHDCAVLTANISEFKRIPGLTVIQL